jgi:transposase
VAQAEGVNANQAFAWRRLHRAGKLAEDDSLSTTLLPVIVNHREPIDAPHAEEQPHTAACGSINIEIPGRALISVDSGADARLLRTVLESLRK